MPTEKFYYDNMEKHILASEEWLMDDSFYLIVYYLKEILIIHLGLYD